MAMFRKARAKIKALNPHNLIDRSSSFARRVAESKIGEIEEGFLYTAVSGLHGDASNDNGDHFEWETELLRQRPDGAYVYETWRGKPNLVNHDENIVIGQVVDTWPELDEKSIDMLLKTKRNAFRIGGRCLARAVEEGVITDVSMGVLVGHSICSLCENVAYTEDQWCNHLRYYKGKKDPDTGQLIYENNKDCYGIELSWICAGVGADPVAKQKYILARSGKNPDEWLKEKIK